jgi:hypothetical protein
MKQFGLACLWLSIACALSATARAQAEHAQNPPIAIQKLQAVQSMVAPLELIGSSGEHINISAAEFHTLPRQTVQVHNAHTGETETYQGVELSVLLARLDAPLGQKLHGKALAMYVVAEGTDKYRALYSLAEVDPSFHNGMPTAKGDSLSPKMARSSW